MKVFYPKHFKALRDSHGAPMAVDKRNAHSGVYVDFSHQAAALLSKSIQSS